MFAEGLYCISNLSMSIIEPCQLAGCVLFPQSIKLTQTNNRQPLGLLAGFLVLSTMDFCYGTSLSPRLWTARVEGGTCCFLAGPTAIVGTGKAPEPSKICCVACTYVLSKCSRTPLPLFPSNITVWVCRSALSQMCYWQSVAVAGYYSVKSKGHQCFVSSKNTHLRLRKMMIRSKQGPK